MAKIFIQAASIAAVVFFLAFVSLSVWRSLQPAAPQHEGQRTEQAETKNAEAQPHKGFLDRTVEDPVAFFTLWLTLFTGILAAFTIWLSLSTSDLRNFAEEQARDMKASISESVRSADAAEKSAQAAIEQGQTMRAQLRAYVSIQSAKPATDKQTFVLGLKNVGQSPARNVKGHLSYQWYANRQDLPPDFAFPNLSRSNDPSSVVSLVREQETPMIFGISEERFSLAEKGEISLFLYGEIEYLDIFGSTQMCQFCYKILTPRNGVGQMQMWHTHNDCS